MNAKPADFASDHLADRPGLHASQTSVLRSDGNGRGRRWVSWSTCLTESYYRARVLEGKETHTLGLFVVWDESGVPSLLSLVFEMGNSSLTGRTLRSAYFLQFVPQVSQRILVGSPFGAFHQTLDSRLLQAPQLGVLEGCAIMEDSSSEWPTRWPSCTSAGVLYCNLVDLGDGPDNFRRLLASPSFILSRI